MKIEVPYQPLGYEATAPWETVQIDFFDDDQRFLQSKVLQTGDVILLAAGGHGLTFLEQSEIIEVKQGPYLQDKDKIRLDHQS